MYPRNDNLFIKKWTGLDKHYFIVARFMRGEEIMGKVISFEDYKLKKDIESRPVTLEEKLQFREEFIYNDDDIDYEELMKKFCSDDSTIEEM